MVLEEKDELRVAIWEGCHHDLAVAHYALCIGARESSLKVRKWCPEVKNRTDYMGAHYNVLWAELRKTGILGENPKAWKDFLKDRPDVGTYLACRWFSRIVEAHGLKDAVEIWNDGETGTEKGLKYRASVESCFFIRFSKTGGKKAVF